MIFSKCTIQTSIKTITDEIRARANLSQREWWVGLSDFFEDDADSLFLKAPNPANENVQIVCSTSRFQLIFGGIVYFSSKDIHEVLWMAITVHTVYDIQYPECIKNLSIAVLQLNKCPFMIKQDEKISARVINKCKKIGINLN